MKVYRHFVAGISGSLDLERLTERITDRYSDISTEKVKLLGSVEGLRCPGISKGTVSADGSNASFSLDILFFRKHAIIFEFSFEAPELDQVFLDPGLIKRKIEITSEGETTENPLYMHGWMIYFDLFEFSGILSKLADVNMLDDGNHRQTHDAIRENSLIDCYYMGEQTSFQTLADMGEYSILSQEGTDEDKHDNATAVFEGSERVLLEGRVYRVSGYDESFMEIHRYLLYRKSVLLILNKLMDDWFKAAREQAVLIRDNLRETNKVYWSRLKNRLEIWDLNFLDLFAAASSAVNIFDAAALPGISTEFHQRVEKMYEISRTALLRNMEGLKYAISNLRTPCEAHDEELLQKETEKVNERIMLLSFLAMSIPLLGAILAPGIAATTKLIAAVFLFSLPSVYIYLRRVQKRKGQNRATVDYLSSQRRKLMEEIENTRATLNRIIEGDTMGEKTKSQTTEFLQKTLATSEKYLRDIEREIEKYS